MKKIVSLLILILFVFGAVACGQPTNEGDQNGNGGEGIDITETYEGTINFCIPFGADLPAYQKLVEEYNKYQPKVTVKLKNESTEERYFAAVFGKLDQSVFGQLRKCVGQRCCGGFVSLYFAAQSIYGRTVARLFGYGGIYQSRNKQYDKDDGYKHYIGGMVLQ